MNIKIPGEITWPQAICGIAIAFCHCAIWIGFWSLFFIYGCNTFNEMDKNRHPNILQENK